ncbi:E3 SUMO-protein ligase KIAA1586-like [Mercenaria mercenaria]|uniref:E3 SUMO-protein ligase KIAA1586-like n=1 Tax=Mercenaria mercenaria TaxID=6596 RepID=UPI00234E9B03|nr:E3 SUMO-protein ligase KIAA1586-like [Mercenaria mercenaria]
MKMAQQTALGKSEAAITAALKNVYFAAKNDLANSMVPELNNLCLKQGVSQISDLKVDAHTTYEHHSSIGEFQEALAGVLVENLQQKLLKSPKFSLMFDESTDTSVSQNLIVYIRSLDYDVFDFATSNTCFLAISSLHRANADAIYSKVLQLLSQKGLDLSNLCGVCTDGASVMIGSKSGVVTRLKQSVPGVLSSHCIAHRLALSCSTGADTIPYLVKFQEILNSVFKYFHNSPKNMSTLSAIQSVLQKHSTRFQEVFHTRWLSFEGAVSAIVSNYSSLLSCFLEENSGKALSLYKPVATYKFLYVAHFLSDVLSPLAILSKMYQQKNLMYSDVEPLLTSTISTLESLKEKKNGTFLSAFLGSCPPEPTMDGDGLFTFEFQSHTIRDSAEQRRVAVSVCDKFVDNMVSSLHSRFSDNADSVVMKALSNLFNPSITDVGADCEAVSEYLGTVGFEGRRNELVSFVSYSRALAADTSNKTLKDSVSCANLAIKNRHSYPATAEAAERFLILPVSTADCERGFSKQNLIKTALRNSLSISSLENLMHLSIDGPPLADFPYKRAFKAWASAKSRRILM